MNYDVLYTFAVQKIGRTLHWKENLKDDGKGYDGVTKPLSMTQVDRKWSTAIHPGAKPKPDANLVSSLLENGSHAPALDIDIPMHAVPSSTPGHHHLYFDKEMPWEDYEKLLRVMCEVGLIEEGYYKAAMKFKQTYLRLPHVKKGDENGST